MAEMGQTQPQAAVPGHHAPDLQKEAAARKAAQETELVAPAKSDA